MVRSLRWSLICVGSAFAFAACSLDADIPGRNNDASKGSAAGTRGTGAFDDDDASRVGDASAIANGIAGDDSGASEGEKAEGSASGGAPRANSGRSGGAGASQASAGRSASGGALQASTGGIDSGGASRASAGGIGGAVSSRGGAAGAGGETTKAQNPFAGSAGAADTTNSSSPPTLFFSEYVEGSSSNKALEVAARERTLLDGCKITTYFNGRSDATVVASLTGILEAGQVLTVCTSTLKEKIGSICNQVGNLTFNGNDAVAISCDSTILDLIGQIGVDPGAAWGTDPDSTVDHTLRRNCTVKGGSSAQLRALNLEFDPHAEWQAFSIDTFDGLGSRGC